MSPVDDFHQGRLRSARPRVGDQRQAGHRDDRRDPRAHPARVVTVEWQDSGRAIGRNGTGATGKGRGVTDDADVPTSPKSPPPEAGRPLKEESK